MTSGMSDTMNTAYAPVSVINPAGKSPVLLVCEHASNFIPQDLHNLGLDAATLQSHVAWDPGALGVAKALSSILDARLVSGGISRLVYDCNRPPTAPDAMPEKSEAFEIPGNRNLSSSEKERRTSQVYRPFRQALSSAIQSVPSPSVLVTIHSFTPIYLGVERKVELGILHDTDQRLADSMLKVAGKFSDLLTLRNEPYGPQDGVTHTLLEHAVKNNIANVMLEISNTLIVKSAQQQEVASVIASILITALGDLGIDAKSGQP